MQLLLRAVLIYVSSALSQTPVPMWLVHRLLCLFVSQSLLLLTEPISGGLARLSWFGWLVTYRDVFFRLSVVTTHPSTNSLPSSIRSSTSADTFRRLLKTHCFQQAYCSP